MEENQIKYLGGEGGSVIHAEVTHPTVLEAARTTHPTRPSVCVDACAATALDLLAY